MKSLIASIVLMFSLTALADTTVLLETKNYDNYDVSTTFTVNKELGRAWVTVTLGETFGDSTYYNDTRVKVEGLSYDAATRSIVLDKDGEQIVCASLYNRRFIIDGGNSIRNSGRCKFSVKKFKKEFDNGFEIYKVPMLQVLMTVE